MNQAGKAACVYSVTPAIKAFASTGGSTAVNVSTAAGCAWSIGNSLSWIHVPQGFAGSGSGSFTMLADANPGGARSGAVTVAGATVPVSQGAGSVAVCGANDVSGEVTATQGAFFACSPFSNLECQRVTVRNNSTFTIPGPIYMVMDGLPKYYPNGCSYGCGLVVSPPLTHCQSPGSYLYQVTSGPIGPGQVISLQLSGFVGEGAVGGNIFGRFNYTTRIFSGTPNQ